MKIGYKKIMIVAICAVMLFASSAMALSNVVQVASYINYNVRMTYNGQEYQPRDIDGTAIRPIIYEGRSYLPVRAIAELAGLNVDWNEATQTILISSSGGIQASNPAASTPYKDSKSYQDRIAYNYVLSNSYLRNYLFVKGAGDLSSIQVSMITENLQGIFDSLKEGYLYEGSYDSNWVHPSSPNWEELKNLSAQFKEMKGNSLTNDRVSIKVSNAKIVETAKVNGKTSAAIVQANISIYKDGALYKSDNNYYLMVLNDGLWKYFSRVIY